MDEPLAGEKQLGYPRRRVRDNFGRAPLRPFFGMAMKLVGSVARSTRSCWSQVRDLAEAVRIVQDEGLRCIVAPPKDGGVAPELIQLADEVVDIDAQVLRGMLQAREGAATATGDGRRDGARAP